MWARGPEKRCRTRRTTSCAGVVSGENSLSKTAVALALAVLLQRILYGNLLVHQPLAIHASNSKISGFEAIVLNKSKAL